MNPLDNRENESLVFDKECASAAQQQMKANKIK
jgi:hypothetical protein